MVMTDPIADMLTRIRNANQMRNATVSMPSSNLKAEIAKREAPTLFQINGPVGYKTWKYYCEDLSNTELYSWLLDQDLAVKDAEGVYGIPYVVEGYGIIYNDKIMRDYFALADKAVSISSTAEIKNFDTLKAVVEDMQAKKDQLGIEGVFASTSFKAGEDWRWQTHLANLPIYYEFKDNNVSDANEIALTYKDNYKNIFDLYINNSCTEKQQLGTKSVEDSMAEFALGDCAMVQNGNWGWGQISATEGNVVTEENCKYLPIYTGLDSDESQGLCIGTENYVAVNNLASEEDQLASIAFLEWLYSSDVGKSFVTNDLQFITVFNTFDASEAPSNPLAVEVSSYLNDSSKSSVPWNFTAFPGQAFKDGLSNHLYAYAQGQEDWSKVEEFVVQKWAEMKSGE